MAKKTKREGDNTPDAREYLARATKIDPLQLQDEFVRAPSDVAYWNDRYADAIAEYLVTKIERERIVGMLMTDAGLADELELRLEKKPTVDQLKAYVNTKEEYLEARGREARADAEQKRMRGVVEALSTKRDMLISLGAHIRLEMQQDPLLRRTARDDYEADDAGDGDDEAPI